MFTAPHRDRVRSQSLEFDIIGFDDCGDHLPHAGLDGRTHFQTVICRRQRIPGVCVVWIPVRVRIPANELRCAADRQLTDSGTLDANLDVVARLEAADETGVGAVQPNLEDVLAVHGKIMARHDPAA